jgi:hypothetical protein
MFITILNIVAPVAFSIFLLGIGLKLGRVLLALVTRRRFHGITERFEGAPPRLGAIESLQAVLFDPINHFYRRANRTWSRGYVFYHLAIVTEVIGYSISALIVLTHVLAGSTVPDVALHRHESHNYSPANLLALVFGNGEALQGQFLFGSLAPLFAGFTWVAVGFAVVGNLHLLVTLLRRRSAAVLSDLDPAARGVRVAGRLPWDRLLVRSLIFCIIWTELFARLELVPDVVFVHAALGLALFTLFPFTYLFHMVYAMVAVFFATRRRMARTLA